MERLSAVLRRPPVSALLVTFSTRTVTVGRSPLNEVIGHAALTAATILGLRVLAAIRRRGK